MIEKILLVGAWVFIVIGILSIILGVVLEDSYKDSWEEKLDSLKGIRKSYKHVTKFGFISFIISLIVLIANYI